MKYPYSDIYADKAKPRRFSIPTTDPSQMARDWMGQAAGTYGRMQAGSKTKTERPGHTAGGALYAAGGAGATGAMIGSMYGGGAAAGAGAAGAGAGTGLIGGMGSGAAAGAGAGTAGGPPGWVIGGIAGAVIGLGAYLFS